MYVTSELAQRTFEAFEPFINVFDCGGSYFAGVYHLIPKEAWELYGRHKQGERNLRFEDGEKFNVYQDIIRNIYSPLHVQKHMVEGELSYYTSGKQGLGLYYLDIDAHHAWQQDQLHARAVLEKIFPEAYYRDSGRGQNGFLKVRYSSVHQFNETADKLEKWLQELFLYLGILCDIEVKGTITHQNKSGRLGKLPFATRHPCATRNDYDSWDFEQLQIFKSCPIVNARRIRHVAEGLVSKVDEQKVQKTREIKERLLAEEKASQEEIAEIERKYSATQQPSPLVSEVAVSPKASAKRKPARMRTTSNVEDSRSEDAFVRNHEDIPPFVRAFFKRHRRFPTAEETLDWLKFNNLYSGEWEDNQEKRATRVGQILRFKEQTFDPEMLSGGKQNVVDLRLGRFTNWVRRHFGAEMAVQVVEVQKFDPVSMTAPTAHVMIPAKFVETFLVVADVCLKQDPLDNKAVPTNRFKALWKLVENGAAWNQRHFQIVRDRFHRMGVIKIVDRHHERGKAWRWEAGSRFPSFMSKEESRRLKRSRRMVVAVGQASSFTNTTNSKSLHNTLYQPDAEIRGTRGWKLVERPPP